MKKIIVGIMVIVLVFMISGCDEYTLPERELSTFEQQSKQNEENVKDLVNRNELPKLTRSLDFENVKQRLEYLNQANNIGYMYLLTSNGQLIKEVQVLGKITSLNTYITPMEEIRKLENSYSGVYSGVYEVIQAPDLDGTYGENVNGVFWFTPDGVYREWTGLYLFSAERLSFTTQPLLVEVNN